MLNILHINLFPQQTQSTQSLTDIIYCLKAPDTLLHSAAPSHRTCLAAYKQHNYLRSSNLENKHTNKNNNNIVSAKLLRLVTSTGGKISPAGGGGVDDTLDQSF